MIGDHPLGAGGGAAFVSPLGISYLARIGIFVPRSVHNGYLDIAASWGIHGFLLYLGAIGTAWWQVRKGIKAAHRQRSGVACLSRKLYRNGIGDPIGGGHFPFVLAGRMVLLADGNVLGYARVVSDTLANDDECRTEHECRLVERRARRKQL